MEQNGKAVKHAEKLDFEILTLDEYQSAIRSQGVVFLDVTHQCPVCGELQSMNDLIDAGAGKDQDEVSGYIGFSCIGRWDEYKGCNYTLGGLFVLNNMAIVTPNGENHPRFRPAPREF